MAERSSTARRIGRVSDRWLALIILGFGCSSSGGEGSPSDGGGSNAVGGSSSNAGASAGQSGGSLAGGSDSVGVTGGSGSSVSRGGNGAGGSSAGGRTGSSGGASSGGRAATNGGAGGAATSGGSAAGGRAAASGGAPSAGGMSQAGGSGACTESDCGSHKWACWKMPNPASSGAAVPNHQSLSDLGNGTVRDNITCLVWEKANPTAQGTWQDAYDRCAKARSGWLRRLR